MVKLRGVRSLRGSEVMSRIHFEGPPGAALRTPFCWRPKLGWAVVLFAATVSTPMQAQTPAVLVTATRTPAAADQALAEVTVLDRRQIDAAAGRSLSELLAQQPGLQFWSNGGLGKASSVSVRGLESRHVLLLIDGVRHGSATVGTPNWDNIALDSIERIEIVRGPLSGLYGSDAVAAVVQVFLRRGAAGVAGNAALSVGSNAYRQVGGGLRWGFDAWDGAVQLQQTRNRGFSATNPGVPFGSFNADDDGFRQRSASLQLGLRLPGAWRLEGRLLDAVVGNQYDDGPGVDAKADTLTRVMSVQLAGQVLSGWRSSLRVSRSVDELNTLSSASAFAALGVIGTSQQQLSWDHTLRTPVGELLLLAERVEQEVTRPGAPFAVSQRSILGLGLGLSGQAAGQRWQLSLRSDRNSQFGRQNTGTLGYGLDLTPQLRAAFSIGKSFVMPSFNQLYFPNFGNPKLLPEEGVQRELSLRWADLGQTVHVSYFDNRIRGYISSGPLPVNIPRVRSDGFSLSYQAVLAAWTLAASADLIDPRNDTANSANFGRVLPRRAKEMLRAAADVDLGAFKLGGSLSSVGPRFENAANTTPVAGYATLDLRADWRLARHWSLGLKLNNLANRRYETTLGYNQPGRELYASLRYVGS